jgi:hypothetical protein
MMLMKVSIWLMRCFLYAQCAVGQASPLFIVCACWGALGVVLLLQFAEHQLQSWVVCLFQQLRLLSSLVAGALIAPCGTAAEPAHTPVLPVLFAQT